MDEPNSRLSADSTWAKQSLDLNDRTGPISLTDVLQTITNADYFLSAERTEAVRLISDPKTAAPWAHRREEEFRLTEDMKQFTQNFFEIASAERKAQWNSLLQRCSEFPSLRLWLEQLKPALDISLPVPSKDERVNELVKAARDTFILRFPERIQQQRKFLSDFRDELDVSSNAFKELRSKAPRFLKIVAPWMSDLLGNEAGYGFELVHARPNPMKAGWNSARNVYRKIKEQSSVRGWVIAIAIFSSLIRNIIPKEESTRVARGEGYFLKLRHSSPQIYDRLCRENPDIREALERANLRETLDRFALSHSWALDWQIRQRYSQDRVYDPIDVAESNQPKFTDLSNVELLGKFGDLDGESNQPKLPDLSNLSSQFAQPAADAGLPKTLVQSDLPPLILQLKLMSKPKQSYRLPTYVIPKFPAGDSPASALAPENGTGSP